jgi:hypothetical protein
MLRPHPLAHLRQQLLPKLLLAQTPTTPNRLELLAFLRTAPFLYVSISRTDPFSNPLPSGIRPKLLTVKATRYDVLVDAIALSQLAAQCLPEIAVGPPSWKRLAHSQHEGVEVSTQTFGRYQQTPCELIRFPLEPVSRLVISAHPSPIILQCFEAQVSGFLAMKQDVAKFMRQGETQPIEEPGWLAL